jgi:hypothetical protein
MPRLNTKSAFKNMDRVKSIEAHLRECANTCRSKASLDLVPTPDRGLYAEYLVMQNLLCKVKSPRMRHRWETPYAEIDLYFEWDHMEEMVFDSWSMPYPVRSGLIVEVKTLGKGDWLAHRLTNHQMERLQRARAHVSSLRDVDVELALAIVHRDKSIEWFRDL